MSLRLEAFTVGPMGNNLYLLLDDAQKEFVVVDPSLESDVPFRRAQELVQSGYTMTAIWNTHGHFDHVYENARWKTEFDVPIYVHEADKFFLEYLKEQSIWFGFPAPEVVPPDFEIQIGHGTLFVGEHSPEILFLPGHSPGSVGFYFREAGFCISGDVILGGSIGRTDLMGASEADLADSLRRLFQLPPNTVLLPGHAEPSTIGEEMESNDMAAMLIERYPAS